jgi:hypothetical protein
MKINRRSASAFSTYTDHGGRRIVKAHATHGVTFDLWEVDWLRVCEDFTPTWFTLKDGKGHQYIAGNRYGFTSPVMLARAIVAAGRGERVQYKDGNRFNLKRDNLVIVEGPSQHSVPEAGYRPSVGASANEKGPDDARLALPL